CSSAHWILHSFPTRRSSDLTLDASLVGAVDIGEGKRPLRYLAERGKVPVEHHVSARERAGLVTAENVHAAEVLDRLEMHLAPFGDRKSTRLNSSHGSISYAV